MEERVPPPGEPPSKLGAAFRSGTYLVQLPKDQVYRVPPPENALIVERHGNPVHQTNYCSFCRALIIIFLIILLVLITGAIFFIYFLKPNSPTFFIDHFVVNNVNGHISNHSPEYDFVLKTKTPNSAIGIDYSSGGSAALSFKQQKIAIGNPQVLDRGTEERKGFRVVFVGSNVVLPREVQKSIKEQSSISLFLSVNVPVKMKIGVVKTWIFNMGILCNLTSNSLAKNTRIMSQKCRTMI